jgi:hypothetical protein
MYIDLEKYIQFYLACSLIFYQVVALLTIMSKIITSGTNNAKIMFVSVSY